MTQERDPAYPGGFLANYTSPPLAVDPVSITIKTENSNVVRWQWENLHPTQTMQDNPAPGTTAWSPAPLLNISVFHDFWARTEPGVDKRLLRDHYGKISYTPFGHCTTQGILAFDGTIDGAGSSGWMYQCPSSNCVATNISSEKEETYLWAEMSAAEQQRWRDGMLIGYRPVVGQSEALGVSTPCASNVPWETNHWWWNWSDFRSTVRIYFTATY